MRLQNTHGVISNYCFKSASAMSRLLLGFTVCLFLTYSLALECYNVNTKTNRQVDEYGRERYFHGVNVVVKGPPWIPEINTFDPIWSFSEKDMQYLNDLGLNTIRFGMMWPGAEPTKDVFNQTYFDVAKELISRCKNYNISVLVDMHQDVFNPQFCGEGFPDWAVDIDGIKDFPMPLGSSFHTNGTYPTKKQCSEHGWGNYQFTFAVNAAYQSVYSNKSGLLDQLAQYWGKVAEEFKDFDNVIGYELINEPWAGDIFKDPLLLIPKEADKRNLAHVYDVVNKEIRKHDTCHNVFFEPLTWDILTTGFDQVPGGPQYNNRSVLSYHFYFPPQLTASMTFTERRKDIERLSCAGFLTEFNINSLNSDDTNTMNLADEYMQSWTGWDYKQYYDITGDSGAMWFPNGSINEKFVRIMSRTYAYAVSGITKKMSFNTVTHSFILIYTTSSSCTSKTTEIYLNKDQHYPNGYKVVTVPDQELTHRNIGLNRLQVSHSPSLKDGTTVTIAITET